MHLHVNAINIPEQLLSAYELLLQTESERNIDITISPFPDYFFSFAVINMEPPPGTMGEFVLLQIKGTRLPELNIRKVIS